MRSADDDKLGPVLSEQAAYYQAIAGEYYDHYLDVPGGEELTAALDAFRPAGSVLELACGRGAWTSQLLRHATDVTAVDASPEMLAIAATRAGSERVRFIQADLFAWEPDRRYDVVLRLLERTETTPASADGEPPWQFFQHGFETAVLGPIERDRN